MSLIEKLSSIKDKTAETEKRISSIEKQVNELNSREKQINELNSRLNNVDHIIKKISDIDSRMNDLTKKIEQKVSSDEKRVQNFESQVKSFESQVKSFESQVSKFESLSRGNEKQHETTMKELGSKITASEIRIKELESQLNSKLSKFVDETRKFEGVTKNQENIREKLETQMDNILETLTKNQKDMESQMESFSTQKDVSALRSNLLKFDDILKAAMKQHENQIANFESRLNQCVENDALQRRVGELKVDLATTEGNFRKMVEDLKEEMDEIKGEEENYPRIDELQEQNIGLVNKLKAFEQKTNTDFDKILFEIQKLGSIFAKRGDVAAIDNKINTLAASVNPQALYQLQSELETIKKQIISTQNALVELNSFIQENLSQ